MTTPLIFLHRFRGLCHAVDVIRARSCCVFAFTTLQSAEYDTLLYRRRIVHYLHSSFHPGASRRATAT
mgnify:CR=1 FL=1